MRERLPIDGALRRYLDGLAPGAAAAIPDEERVRAGRALMLWALERRGAIPGLPNGVETRDVATAQGLSLRLYTPGGAGEPLPVLLYLHGGGWVNGSIATHDPFCRLLSESAGVMVASVEYRVAPENRFPAAVEDTVAAYQWAVEEAAEWGGDPARLGLGGDSAGANLAAVAAHRLCVAARPRSLRALLLLYPVTDSPDAGHRSWTENATGYGLEAGGMRWYWEQYAPGDAAKDPDAAPLQADEVPGLPPTLVMTAEYDVLRDEGIAYAQKLEAAGVAVTHLHAPDMHHNFPVHPGTVMRFPQSEMALRQMADWLRETFAEAE